ncbi:trimeric autotransporter adhesin, partial [Vespertiliibacter pulmonis]
ANTTNLSPNASKPGAITEPTDKDSLITAENVAKAINASGWIVKANGDNATGSSEQPVHPGDQVVFEAGKNMKLEQNGSTFIYKTADNVSFTHVNATDGVTLGNDPEKPVNLTAKDGNLNVAGKDNAPVKITNVANGTEPNDAVNFSQLNSTVANSGFNLTSANKGGQTEDKAKNDGDKRINNNETFTLDAGKNIKITQVKDGYEVATTDELNATKIIVGKDGKDGANAIAIDGVNGTIGIKGEDGKDAIAINGKDGTIGVKGADGKDGVTINGKDGAIGLNGKDGKSANITVASGKTTVDPKDNGANITRIVYKDENGNPREVATMDDGLKFKGDNDAVINRTLGSQLNITGGADQAKLVDNNIGVYGDVANNSLVVKLAKDINLTPNGSVTLGNTTINNDGLTIKDGPSITKDGINAGDKPITNVTAGTNGTDAVNVDQLKDGIAKSGFNLTSANKGGQIEDKAKNDGDKRINNNETFTLDAGKNIKITQVKDGYEVATTDELNATKIIVGKDGKDGANAIAIDGVNGTIGIKGEDGKDAIAINGKDGTIGVKGADGKDGVTINGKDGAIGLNGKDGKSANITVAPGKTTVDPADNNANITRIVYKDENGKPREVATMDDGLKFMGDTGNVSARKLGETLNIIGGAKEGLTDNNIGVDSDGKGNLTVKLSKDINLTPNGSLHVGNVTINKDGINAGDQQITHVESGLGKDKPTDNQAFLDKLANVTGDALNNAVNVGDLKQVAQGTEAAALAKAGFNLTTKKVAGSTGESDDSEANDKRIATNDTFTLDAGNNIVVKQIDNGYAISTKDDIVFGKAGKDGKDGVDGKVAVNGKDGVSGVTINGKDGSIGLTGPAGKDGKSPSAEIHVVDGAKGLNGNDGKDGESKTRIEYIKPNGEKETIATLNDGLKFAGDDDKVIDKPLNSRLDIVGGADKNKLSEKNIGVNEKDGKLLVQLAKDINLTKDGSVTIGDTTLNDNGLTIKDGPSVTKDGINAGDKKITNVKDGDISPDSKDAVNGSQLYQVKDDIHNEIKNSGWDLQGNGKDVSKVKPNDKVNFVNGQGTTVKVENKGGVNTISVDSPLAYVNENADDKSTPSNKVNLVGKGDAPVSLGNVESGLGKKDKPLSNEDFLNELAKAAGDTLNNAVNVGDLKQVAQGTETAALAKAGFNLTTKAVEGTNGKSDDSEANDKRIATNDTFTLDAGNNIVVKQIDNGYAISTKDDIVFGKAGKDGKDGVDGKVAVNGKDGVSGVTINGKDGSIGLTGPAGKDGKSPSAEIHVVDGAKGLNGNDGKDGESKTRIEYIKPNGEKETIATLNDGLKFAGDDGKVIDKPLNSRLDIVGGADKNKLSGKNIGVNEKDGKLLVQLAKDIDLTKDGSVKTGDTVINNHGLTIKDGPSVTKDGINAGDKKITNVADGEISANSKDAVNGGQLYQVASDVNNVANEVAKGWNVKSEAVKGSSGKVKGSSLEKVKMGDTVKVNAGNNIEITQKGKEIEIATSMTPEFNTVTATDKIGVKDGPSISKEGINANNKVISNVAPGKNPNDAVNVSQLKGVAGNLHNHINKVDKDLRGGIAGALASAELYHATLPGKSMVSAGVGTYRGQSAVAVGYSRLSDNGKIGIKFSANTNSRGNMGAAASVGYQW